jgi:hypothetical protein
LAHDDDLFALSLGHLKQARSPPSRASNDRPAGRAAGMRLTGALCHEHHHAQDDPGLHLRTSGRRAQGHAVRLPTRTIRAVRTLFAHCGSGRRSRQLAGRDGLLGTLIGAP